MTTFKILFAQPQDMQQIIADNHAKRQKIVKLQKEAEKALTETPEFQAKLKAYADSWREKAIKEGGCEINLIYETKLSGSLLFGLSPELEKDISQVRMAIGAEFEIFPIIELFVMQDTNGNKYHFVLRAFSDEDDDTEISSPITTISQLVDCFLEKFYFRKYNSAKYTPIIFTIPQETVWFSEKEYNETGGFMVHLAKAFFNMLETDATDMPNETGIEIGEMEKECGMFRVLERLTETHYDPNDYIKRGFTQEEIDEFVKTFEEKW